MIFPNPVVNQFFKIMGTKWNDFSYLLIVIFLYYPIKHYNPPNLKSVYLQYDFQTGGLYSSVSEKINIKLTLVNIYISRKIF